MRNNPLILSILLGIIIILIIGGVSLSVKLNYTSKNYEQTVARTLELEKTNKKLEEEKEVLRKNNIVLKEKIESLEEKIKSLEDEKKNLEVELEKTRRLKEKLEESLKEELMKEDRDQR